MVTNSKPEEKKQREIVICYSKCDSEIATGIRNYCENNKGKFQVDNFKFESKKCLLEKNDIDNFESEFEECPNEQNEQKICKRIRDVINGKIDCLIIIFSQKSVNYKWLKEDAEALLQPGMTTKSMAVILVNWDDLSDTEIPKEISQAQEILGGLKYGRITPTEGGFAEGGFMQSILIKIIEKIKKRTSE